MSRTTLVSSTLLVAMIAAVEVISADRVLADEMKVVSSDATASYVPLQINKGFLINLSKDIKDVLVTSPHIADVVVHSNRRAYIGGLNLGDTNVYFYDANHNQILGLTIAVVSYPVPPLEIPSESGVVSILRGPSNWISLNCTRTACYRTEGGAAQGGEAVPAPADNVNGR
jgi:Flp pilus assembly secretin CpaC